MNALVTGGGGFLGRWIVAKLLDRGDAVAVLGRRAYPDLADRSVDCLQADLRDRDAVLAACEGRDAVFHVAAKAGIWGAREEYYDINTTGTSHVLTACQKHRVPRLVYTSTPSVVIGDAPIEGGDESLPYLARYRAPYPETKALAERMVLEANGEAGVATCALRPHLIWGPGDTNLVPRLLARARTGRLMRIGDGTNRISVSYVENIADAHLTACDRLSADSPAAGQCYFVNEEEPVNCWEFIGRLVEGFGCPLIRRAVSLKTALRFAAVLEWVYGHLNIQREPPITRFTARQLATSHWFRIDKAKRDLGWQPAVGQEDGLRRLFADPGFPA